MYAHTVPLMKTRAQGTMEPSALVRGDGEEPALPLPTEALAW